MRVASGRYLRMLDDDFLNFCEIEAIFIPGVKQRSEDRDSEASPLRVLSSTKKEDVVDRGCHIGHT